MDKKRIIIILLIIICILLSCILYQTFLSPKANYVTSIDNVTFNTTFKTDFKLHNETEGWKYYLSETKDERYTLSICDSDTIGNELFYLLNCPSQTINGIVIYTGTANTGQHIGEPTYVAVIENKDIGKGVKIGSSDPKETAKMASSLKFS